MALTQTEDSSDEGQTGWRISKTLFVQCKQYARGPLADCNYVLTIHSYVGSQGRCANRGRIREIPV